MRNYWRYWAAELREVDRHIGEQMSSATRCHIIDSDRKLWMSREKLKDEVVEQELMRLELDAAKQLMQRIKDLELVVSYLSGMRTSTDHEAFAAARQRILDRS